MKNEEEFEITEVKTALKPVGAKIAVIGVGGGGGNMLNHLAELDIADQVKTIAANTDAQKSNRKVTQLWKICTR